MSELMHKATPFGKGAGLAIIPSYVIISLTQEQLVIKEILLPFEVLPGAEKKIIVILLGCGILQGLEDYYISVQTNRLSWTGYNLQKVPLQVGDRLQIYYPV